MLTTTSVLSAVDVQPTVQRWGTQSTCPFLTEIACARGTDGSLWGDWADAVAAMQCSWDEMHGLEKSMSTGSTVVKFNSLHTETMPSRVSVIHVTISPTRTDIFNINTALVCSLSNYFRIIMRRYLFFITCFFPPDVVYAPLHICGIAYTYFLWSTIIQNYSKQ